MHYVETSTGVDPGLHLPAQTEDEEAPKVGSRTVTPIYQWRLLNANCLETDLTKARWLKGPVLTTVLESLTDKRALLKQPAPVSEPSGGLAPTGSQTGGGGLPSLVAPSPSVSKPGVGSELWRQSFQDALRRRVLTRQRKERLKSLSLQPRAGVSFLRRAPAAAEGLLRPLTATARRKQSLLRRRRQRGLLSPGLFSATPKKPPRAGTRRRRRRRGASAQRRAARRRRRRTRRRRRRARSTRRKRRAGPTQALMGASRATARGAPTRRAQAIRASRFFGSPLARQAKCQRLVAWSKAHPGRVASQRTQKTQDRTGREGEQVKRPKGVMPPAATAY